MNRESPLDSTKIHSLVDLFEARAAATPSSVAYQQYLPGLNRWHGYTWNDVATRVRCWQAALSEEALEPGDRIAIMSSNRPEWVAADIAALSLGLVVVALYKEDTAGNAGNTLAHAGAKLLVVEEPQWWADIEQQLDLPDLQRVVSITAGISRDDQRAVEIANWLPSPESAPAHLDHARLPQADDLAVICYTSGTSGRPKGVMLSHANILSNVFACAEAIPMRADDVALSFLPLAHMFERSASYYHAMYSGAQLAFSRSASQLGKDFREIRPTVIISVPRVFERFHALIQSQMRKKPALIRGLFQRCVQGHWQQFQFEQGQRESRASWFWLWRRLGPRLTQPVLNALGGRIRLAVSGGAPLSPDIAKSFIGLGVPLLQGYGLTEASPVVSTNRLADNDPESVGRPLIHIETRRNSAGELEIRGPGVMQGYWQDEEATLACLSPDGWLSTGDKISRFDCDRIYVVGRTKELIVMSNGEKASPALLEQELLADPLIDQAVVIGEGRPFLSALLVLDRQQAEQMMQEKQLEDDGEFHKQVLHRIQDDLKNQARFAQVRRIAIVNENWTAENGLATPTQKPKRRKIKQHYSELIESLYAGHYSPEDTELGYHVDLS